jgi:hypothetical protein
MNPNTSLIWEYISSELQCDLSDLLRHLRDHLLVVIIGNSKDLEEKPLRGEIYTSINAVKR